MIHGAGGGMQFTSGNLKIKNQAHLLFYTSSLVRPYTSGYAVEVDPLTSLLISGSYIQNGVSGTAADSKAAIYVNNGALLVTNGSTIQADAGPGILASASSTYAITIDGACTSAATKTKVIGASSGFKSLTSSLTFKMGDSVGATYCEDAITVQGGQFAYDVPGNMVLLNQGRFYSTGYGLQNGPAPSTSRPGYTPVSSGPTGAMYWKLSNGSKGGSSNGTSTQSTNTGDKTNTKSSSLLKAPLSAGDISYDNSVTGIECTEAQCALDKIKEMIGE